MSILLPITIDRLRESNTAGGCKLQLVRAEHVASFPEELNGTISASIALVADAAWITITPTLWTHAFGEAWELVEGAQRSVARMQAVIPKDRAALLSGLYGLKPGRYVVLHHDRNGTVKVVGTPTEPAQVRVEELTHGSDPRGDRNQYLLTVVCARLTPCPFYGADPPTPGVPDDCPTLAEQIAESTWAAIEALLSSGQLSDAVASLCTPPDPCPTLCEQVDEAIVLPTPGSGGIEVSGAGDPDADGVYPETGTANGRPGYELGNGWFSMWSGTNWLITDGAVYYVGVEDVPTPDLVTTWNALTAPAPAPSVTTTPGAPGDATDLTDCFSPEQAEVVLGELLGSLTGAQIWALLDSTQQGDALDEAGVIELSGIDDNGPPYTNSFIDT